MRDCDKRHDGACRLKYGLFGWHCMTRPRWSPTDRMEHARTALRDAAQGYATDERANARAIELEACAIDYVDAMERHAGVMRPGRAVHRGATIGLVLGMAPFQAAMGHPTLAALHVAAAAALTIVTLWRLRP